jgi:hypothetical protein
MNLPDPTTPLERLFPLFLDHTGLPNATKLSQVNAILTLYARHQLTFVDAAVHLQSIVRPPKLLKGTDNLPVVPGSRRKPNHWTTDEDERLIAAVQRHGPDNWPLIAGVVGGGRTRGQCSQRWHRGLDPKLLKCNWSQEEEQKLLDSVAVHGEAAWTRVAADIGNRSDVQCRYRYRFLCKKANEMRTEVRPVSLSLSKIEIIRPEQLSDEADRVDQE